MHNLIFGLLLALQPISESIEVRLTNVDAVVVDQAGTPVRGLSQADFIILDHGKPQTITHFAEYNDATATPLVERRPPRHVVMLFDDASLDPFVRNQLFRAAAKAVPHLIDPGDEVLVAVWDGRLNIRQPFTTSIDAALSVIEQQRTRGGGLKNRAATHIVRSDLAAGMATSRNPAAAGEALQATIDSWTEQRVAGQRGFIRCAETMERALAGLDGKKLLLIATGYMPVAPGAELLDYARAQYPTILLHSSEKNLRREHEALAHLAASDEVMIDSIYPRIETGAEGMERGLDPYSDAMTINEIANTGSALEDLARATGGTAFLRAADFDRTLTEVHAQLSTYYSLAFSPSGGGPHEIRIQLRNHPRYRVASRDSFVPRNSDDVARSRVVSNLFRGIAGDFPIRINVGAAVRESSGRRTVPVRVTFPSSITLLPESGGFSGKYSVYIAVADSDANLAPVQIERQPIHVTPQQRSQIEGKSLAHQFQLQLRAGEQTLSILIHDDLGDTFGVARLTVTPDG